MIPNTRNCMVFKHEKFPCSHICTHKDCIFDQRWVCGECMKNDIHKHGQKKQSHLLGQDDFKIYFKQIDFKQQSERENKISQYLRALHQIREQINELDCYLQLCLKESSINILKDLQYLIDNQFFFINNEQISQIVKLKQNTNLTFEQQKVDKSINQIILLSQQLLQANVTKEQMVEYQNQINSQTQKNPKIKILQQQPKQLIYKYQQIQQVLQDQQVLQVQQALQQVQQVQQQSQQQPLFAQVDKKPYHILTYQVFKKFQGGNYIYAAQISQNEKYLAYGGKDKRIIIYNLQQQTTKEMNFDDSIRACCFSRDSNLLYIGCGDGSFHCIQFATIMCHRYKQQLHNDAIWDIYQLENDQALSGSYKNIIISDIKQQKILYKLNAPEGLYFYGLAIKNFHIILTGLYGSQGSSINFYDQKLILLFSVLDATQSLIHQIKFLGDDKIFILDDSSILQWWEIDLNKQTSKKIREIKDKNIIYNVGVSQTKNQIITIRNQYFVIYDSNFQNPQIFEHTQDQGDDVTLSRVMQLQSMNYIIILSYGKIYFIFIQESMTIMKRTEEK